ncbi:MAG: serine hydrolase domain-containing protein [Bacteroidia bacterium]|nr:serine hydrolase domain-containing protein [Bacteroidia bacterium]
MKRILIPALAAVFLALFLAACKSEAVLPIEITNNPKQSALDLAVHDLVQQHQDGLNTVGLSVGFLRHDSLFFYGYGEPALGDGEAPDAHTRFEIGSISKVFTAIAATEWLAEQSLTPDSAIRPWLPADLPELSRGGTAVTFRHLMTHSSGLSYMPGNMGPKLYLNIAEAWSGYDSLKLYDCLRKEKLHAEPGTEFRYSNLAVGTLGTILERSTGLEYGEIIRQRIADPLGLADTKAVLSSAEQEFMAAGYKGRKEIPRWTSLNALDGAGVLRSSAYDLMLFARANLNPPAGPLGEAITRCQQPAFAGPSEDGQAVDMGLGWVLLPYEGSTEPALFHNGGTGGFSTNLFVFKDKQAALCVLFNSVSASQAEDEARRALIEGLIGLSAE